jgi:carbonic anhydrase
MTDRLITGFESFINADGTYGPEGVMTQLVEAGQKPEYFMISCIDSRANPGTIFSPAPGTFFAHKAMGAIVRPYKKGTALAAALQFAINYMNVRKIVVLGHTECGAVKALIDGIQDDEISSFIEVASAAGNKARTKHANPSDATGLLRETERQIVLESIENLKSYPPVKKGLAENRLEIKPWLFDMREGALLEYKPQSDTFERVAGYDPAAAKPNKNTACC